MNDQNRTIALFVACLLVPVLLVAIWLRGAASEMKSASAADDVAIASAAEDEYCSPTLKKVLRRVAGSCGLIDAGGRGCKPADAKAVAALSGNDFNTLFVPLSHRAGIVQFDSDQVDLDDGASFFFVVARASPEGNTEHNQELSQKRAEAVLSHLENHFKDPELRGLVGLLWLGEEFAQLDQKFCDWKRSRNGECRTTDINRSAFVAWIDCAI